MTVYYGNNDWRDYHLAHHGIIGQKWGVRRYQNPDGTLTSAGKERYHGTDEKTEKYRSKALEREADNMKAYYTRQKNALERYSSKLKKAQDAGNVKKEKKNMDRIDALAKDVIFREEISKRERQAIMNMSVKDIKDEKRAYGRRVAINILASGASGVLATALGMPVFPVFGTSKDKFLQNRRVSKQEKTEAAVETVRRFEELKNGKRGD